MDPVVIEFGETRIFLSELQAEVDAWKVSRSLGVDPEQFVEGYVQRLKSLEEARKLGLHEDIGLRHQYENLLIGRLKQEQLKSRLDTLEITDAMIEANYQTNISAYTRLAQARVSLLFLPISEKMSDAQKSEIKQRLSEVPALVAELPEGARGFGALAMHYSEEPTSRFKGGDIGWLQAGKLNYRWPELVVEAAFQLEQVGDLSPIIEAEDGVYLLMKLDGRDSVVRPLNNLLRASIRGKLLKEARADLAQSIQSDWGSETPVEINKEALSLIDFNAVSDAPEMRSSELSSMLPSN